MASPPFNQDITDPADNAIVSQFPANERTFRDNVNSYLNIEHDINTGYHKFQLLSTTAKNALSNPPTGMLVYDTTLDVLQVNTGTAVSPTWTTLGLVQTQTTVASATTTAIGAAAWPYVNISGTTTITAFDTVVAGVFRIVEFEASLTLTNNANIILPSGNNITTNAGDTALFVSEGSGVWRCVVYQFASGAPLLLATKTQMQAATNTTATVTPSQVVNHPGVAKAWVTFNGSSGAILDSFNVTSVIRNALGDYTVNLGITFADTNYVGVVQIGGNATGSASQISQTTTTYRFETYSLGAASNDYNPIMVVFYGNL